MTNLRGMDATPFFSGGIMCQRSETADPHVHALAIALARKCRRVVQACLREEEWGEADRCYYEIIRAGLEDFQKGQKR